MKTVLGVLLAIVLSGVGNTALSLLAQALGESAQTNQGLQPQTYLLLTTVGILIATAAWAAIRSRARNAEAVLRRLVPIVVAVSLVPDVLLLFVGATPLGVVALMLMHIVVAVVTVPILRRVLPLSAARTVTA